MSDPAVPGRERRVHRRRATSAPMWIVARGARVSVGAVNVSIGGAAVKTASKAELGELVRLEVEPEASPAFALAAEVVRSEHGVLGLRFLALGQDALEALLDASGFASEHPPAEDDPSGVRHVGPEEAPRSRRGA